MLSKQQLAAQAEARFKARAMRAIEAPLARAEYDAAQVAVRENTARLRAERLAREALVQVSGSVVKNSG